MSATTKSSAKNKGNNLKHVFVSTIFLNQTHTNFLQYFLCLNCVSIILPFNAFPDLLPDIHKINQIKVNHET